MALRRAVKQLARVGVLRVGKQMRGVGLLNDVAVLHHRHAVGKAAHQVQVMGDEQHRHAGLALQIAEQLQHLRAQRHIQRRGRLIGQQQLGAAGQRHGQHGALALPTRELVRPGLRALRRLRDAGGRQQLNGLRPGGFHRQPLLELQHLGNLLANAHQGVERGHGLLKDHGHIAATHTAQCMLR